MVNGLVIIVQLPTDLFKLFPKIKSPSFPCFHSSQSIVSWGTNRQFGRSKTKARFVGFDVGSDFFAFAKPSGNGLPFHKLTQSPTGIWLVLEPISE
jgi:hypothetical protein